MPQPQHVSVTVPLTQAVDHTKYILFQPFDPGKWLVIGFCAWLAQLGEDGLHGGGGFHTGRWPHTADIRQWLEHARQYVADNLYWLAPLAAGVGLVVVVLWALFVWLSSRGRFMFLHCVARNQAVVVAPWQDFARPANSLFWFRLVLGFLVVAVLLPFGAGIAALLLKLSSNGWFVVGGILGLVGLSLFAGLFGLLLTIVVQFTTDFAVPLMFLRRQGVIPAWRELLSLMTANPGRFLLYLLFRILLYIGLALLVLAVIVATCCICGCFFAVPYLGTVLLLPILVFKRAYSALYLAQYGHEYDVFAPLTAPAS